MQQLSVSDPSPLSDFPAFSYVITKNIFGELSSRVK